MSAMDVICRCSNVDIFIGSPEGIFSIGAFPKASGVIWNVTEESLEVLEPCDNRGNPIFFEEGEEVFLSFAAGNKRKGFKSKVLRISQSPRVVAFSLSHAFEICELRSSVRVPVHLCATFRYPTEEGEVLVGGIVGDITKKGCFATVAGMLPLDIPIICTIYLDHEESVSILSKAVRMTPTKVMGFNGYGIMFDNLPLESEKRLEKAMRDRVPVLREVCSMICSQEEGQKKKEDTQ